MASRGWEQVRSRVVSAWLRRRGAAVGHSCRIAASARVGSGPFVRNVSGLTVGNHCHFDVGALVYTYGGTISLGDDVYIGPYSIVYGHGGVVIGRDTLVAMACSIVSSNHAIPGCEALIRSLPDVKLQTTIGQDCWLGAGVNVVAGVTIEDGCVIGAGSVVTKDIPAYSVAIGIPARVVRCR